MTVIYTNHKTPFSVMFWGSKVKECNAKDLIYPYGKNV